MFYRIIAFKDYDNSIRNILVTLPQDDFKAKRTQKISWNSLKNQLSSSNINFAKE